MKPSGASLGIRPAFAATLFALTFVFGAAIAQAQTNPAAQSLPYAQDFSGLLSTSTTYPTGMQGWTLGTSSPGAAFRTIAPTGDRALNATSANASNNAGNVYNYNGKIGYLNTASLDLTLALAVNTTGKSSIVVNYDVATIRNTYNGTTETRINEVTLQYRVGTTGSFSNLTGIEYQNNTVTQTGAVTTPQNVASKSITLPPACDNQAVVQLRWASREVSGAGGRPSFSFDNISVTGTDMHSLTLNATNGSIAPVPNQALYAHNSVVQLTANANAGYNFVNWSGDASGSTNPLNLTMDANKSVTANFALNTYTINASAGANGTIAPSGAVVVTHGNSQSFTITPNAGYVISDVIVDGGSVGAVGSYNFPNVTTSHTISASFAAGAVVNAVSPVAKITLGNPNVTVPVNITRNTGTPMVLGYSVVIQASSPLLLPAGRFSITLPPGGGFLNADGGRNVLLQTVDLGGGSYQADGVILGAPCGSSALTGTLFNVEVSSAALAGSGTVQISSVTLRDCSNMAIPVESGTIATVNVNRSAPSVTVVAPNGGEIYPVSSTHAIQWTATDPEGVASVDLAYSTDGGATYPNVIATGLANSGTYNWLVPNTVTSMARVRATASDIDANSGFDASDANFTIGCPTINVTGVVTDVLCFGGATGAIDVSVSGGTGPYTFLWSDGPTDEDRSGLVAGSYMVTATDVYGCTGAASFTVNQPLQLVASETHVNVLCFGNTTGAIDVSVSGGTTPYSYAWGDGPTSQDRTALAAGPYSLTVTDANGCTAVVNVTITQPAQLVASESHVNVSCFGGSNGSIDVSVSGGTAPYSYAWADGPTSEDRTGLAAGPYSLTVTDFNGCTAVVNVTITQPAQLVAGETHQNVACFGGTTGSIDVSVSGGTAPYSYAWADGPTSEDRTGLAAGPYSLTVTDFNGCTAVVNVTITQPAAALAASETHVDVLCFGNTTGSIDVSVSGGTTPYSYAWADGPLTEDRSGLAAGPYSLTVTDFNGCTTVVNVTITQPAQLVASETHVNVLCFGNTTGSIDVSVSGGTAPYSYAWADGPTSEDRTGLAAGPYSLTVTDFNGCTTVVNVTITQPAQLVAGETHVNVACFGGTTGSIDVSVSGGTAPYSYAWLDGPTSEDRTGLAAGPYSLTVTDLNGCTAVVNVTITQPAQLVASETHVNVACFGGTTGSIDVSVSGGTAPYSYAWADGPTSEDRTGLAAGPYSLTVTDFNGCTAVVNVTITQPAAALAASETHVNVLCFGNMTGSIDVSVSGGTAPYSYAWADGPTSEDRTGLAAGPYSLTVTDFNGCTTVVNVTITQPTQLVASETHVNALCFGNTTGSIDVSVSGGTTPYSYAWADGPITEDRTGLAAGPYSLTVTDANGCTAVVNVTITQPAQLVASETHTPTCLTSPDGSIDVTVTGGTAPYSYLWSDGPLTEDRTGLAAGPYSLTVTDFNGCTAGVNVTIVLRSYTITASAGANGSIVPSGAVSVTCGADQSFTITADPSYHVDDVVVDAVSQGPQSSWSFLDVHANHTISVTFAVNPAVAAVANLNAAQQLTGNPSGSTTRIQLTWDPTPPGVTVEVWRAPYGHYPRYDDDGGAEPTASATYPPGPGWVLTGVTTSSGFDLPATRDFYYYVAYAQDVYATRSSASNRTNGTLNYHLGDVSDGLTAGAGNNLVHTEDISLLGSHYGVIGAPLLPYSYLDVGPTSTGFTDGRPTTDLRTNFEDLVIFALNYDLVSRPAIVGPSEGGFASNQIALASPARVALGAPVTARITLQGSGTLRALSTRLSWDPAVVEPMRHAAGDWLAQHGGVAFTPEPGVVDAAVFSASGLAGEGVLATVEFKVLTAGDPKIRIASVDGRDSRNGKVEVAVGVASPIAVVPSVTQLAFAQPNPFLETTTIAFSLAASGPVQLAVYGVNGKLLRTLAHDVRDAGEYSMVWDGREDSGVRVTAGVYYVRLVTAQGRFVRATTRLR